MNMKSLALIQSYSFDIPRSGWNTITFLGHFGVKEFTYKSRIKNPSRRFQVGLDALHTAFPAFDFYFSVEYES